MANQRPEVALYTRSHTAIIRAAARHQTGALDLLLTTVRTHPQCERPDVDDALAVLPRLRGESLLSVSPRTNCELVSSDVARFSRMKRLDGAGTARVCRRSTAPRNSPAARSITRAGRNTNSLRFPSRQVMAAQCRTVFKSKWNRWQMRCSATELAPMACRPHPLMSCIHLTGHGEVRLLGL